MLKIMPHNFKYARLSVKLAFFQTVAITIRKQFTYAVERTIRAATRGLEVLSGQTELKLKHDSPSHVRY